MFAKALLVGAFALLASAQSSDLFFTRVPNPVTAGQQIAITYSTNDSSTPVTILLRKGASTDLQTVATLTDSATSGQYIWTPSTSLENAADYALEIKQGSQLNYFGPFSIQGGGASSSSSSTSSSGASSTTTSSAHGYGGVPVITSSAQHNATATSAPASLGTGVPIHRNTTMSHATLTSSSSLTSQTTASSTSESAGFQTTSAAATHTGAASTFASGSSILTLVFGAVAAMLFC